jgi:hypothetical protein
LIAVLVTPGVELGEPPVVVPVDDVVDVEDPLVELVVLDVLGDDEHAAASTATPSATAPGHTQLPRCFPMSTLP